MRVLSLATFILLLLQQTPSIGQQVEVDVELVLAVDVSRSMSRNELEIQRQGYANAMQSKAVIEAIQGGLLQRIAVTYFEWAGVDRQNIIVPWRVVSNTHDAKAFADELLASIPVGMRRTSISGGIEFASKLLDSNSYIGLKQVIDVSGDGSNNDGNFVTGIRDEALAKGIIINGLPIMINEFGFNAYRVADLNQYYFECVIGGPGAFSIPVKKWEEFEEAVRRKLVLELASAEIARDNFVLTAGNDAPYDCLIGEKLRIKREQERDWE